MRGLVPLFLTRWNKKKTRTHATLKSFELWYTAGLNRIILSALRFWQTLSQLHCAERRKTHSKNTLCNYKHSHKYHQWKIHIWLVWYLVLFCAKEQTTLTLRVNIIQCASLRFINRTSGWFFHLWIELYWYGSVFDLTTRKYILQAPHKLISKNLVLSFYSCGSLVSKAELFCLFK
jgi:hypothetical protein